MKRKIISGLLCVSMVASLLMGCGSKSNDSSSANSEAIPTTTDTTESSSGSGSSDTAKSDVTLTLGCSQSQLPSSGIFQTLCDEYEAKTGVHIDIQVTPDDQWVDVLRTKLSVGEAPDIMWADVDGLSLTDRIDPEENCVPLTDAAWAGRMEENVTNDLTINGELYGISFKGYKFWMYYYNKDIFTALGLEAPNTYQEFYDVCQTILASGTIPVYEAVQDGWHHGLMWYEVAGIYQQEIPELFTKLNTNELKVTDVNSMLTVLKEMQECAQAGFYGDDYMSNSMSDDYAAIANGKVAMTFESNGWTQQLETDYPEMKDKMGYFILPWGNNQTLGITPTQNALFINKNSDKIDEAKAFFEYLATPEKLQEYLDGDTAIYSTCWPEIVSKYPEDLQTYMDAHEKGVVLQSGVKFVGGQCFEIEKLMASMFLSELTPEECLQQIANIMDEQGELQNDPYWAE